MRSLTLNQSKQLFVSDDVCVNKNFSNLVFFFCLRKKQVKKQIHIYTAEKYFEKKKVNWTKS